MTRDEESGFTLVELMVVIVIIGLLATVVIVNVMPSRDRAMREKARADISLIEQGLDMYRLDNFTYPTRDQGLRALVARPVGLAEPDRWREGGYLKRLPNDPWGRAYQYANPGKHGAVDVWSWGADGAEGGGGDAADIGNW